MWVKRRRDWELPERLATPEAVYWSRRRLLGAARGMPLFFLGGLFGGSEELPPPKREDLVAPELYPAARNSRFTLERPLTAEKWATTYNNFYEFGSHKQIWRQAQALRAKPWQIVIDGLVEREIVIDVEDLLRRMNLEERLYRHRCVEAWAMAVPWSGFPLRDLVAFARPLAAASYLRMESFLDADVAPGQRQSWYPWPYVEGLTLAEATNELAFIATGIYGKPLPDQNGAPLRLVVPWKYGFKSIKSIVRFTFTDRRPDTFWAVIAPHEYGFWANVNPEVPHPRWSQRYERLLGSDERVPTRIFNGYGEWVADLYRELAQEPLFM